MTVHCATFGSSRKPFVQTVVLDKQMCPSSRAPFEKCAMNAKTIWLTTLGLSLALVAASSIPSATAQLWNPKVSRAAKLTATLLRNKPIQPILFARGQVSNQPSRSLVAAKFGPADEILNYTLTRRSSLDLPKMHLGAVSTRPIVADQSPLAPAITPDLALELESLEFQNWHGSLESTLKHQRLQLQKVELELAQQRYAVGAIDRAQLAQKQADYRIAAQEFKQLLDSSTMAD